MLFLLVLAVATAAIALALRKQPFVVHARLGLAAAMAVAGAAHIGMPEPFVQHLPEWVPASHALIYASGLAEIALGLVLVWPREIRPIAGLALAAYLLAVFPANVYVAVEGVDVDGQPGGVYPWLRLPLQGLFVWLAVWTTDAISILRQPLGSPGASWHLQISGRKGNANA